VYDATGSELFYKLAPTNTKFNTAPAIGDIDGDASGDYEMVIGAIATNSNYDNILVAYHDDGTVIREYHLACGTHYSGITMADLDGDGDLEVITPRVSNTTFSMAGECVEIFDYYDGSFTPRGRMGGQQAISWTGISKHNSPCIGDMNRNGEIDIAMHTDRELYIYEIDSWTTYYPVVTQFVSMAVGEFIGGSGIERGRFSAMGCAMADIQGDEDLELIFTIEDTFNDLSKLYWIDHDENYSSLPFYEDDIEGFLHNSPIVGDVNNDGVLEIAFGGRYYNSGNDTWEYNLFIANWDSYWQTFDGDWPNGISSGGFTNDAHASHPAFADVSGTNTLEILASGTDESSGFSDAWDVYTANSVSLGLTSEDDNSRTAMYVCDIDFDGDLEVVYSSLDESYTPDVVKTYVEDLAVTWDTESVDWSQFQGNAQHTGLYAQPWSSNISADTYWSGHIVITADITLSNDAVLYILPGTVIEFESGTGITVDENGALVCNFWTGSEPIVMKANNSSDTWDGLTFDFNDNTPDTKSEVFGCIIQDYSTQGIKGIDIDTDNLEIKDCEIEGANYGIYLYDVTSAIEISDSEISSTTSAAILLYNSIPYLYEIDVTDCGHGLYMTMGSSPGKVGNCNFSGSDGYGVHARGGSNGTFHEVSGGGSGHNVITNNSDDGVYCTGYSAPNFGYDGNHKGYNTITGHTYEIYNNNSSGSINAQYNWWGGTPNASDFYGSVDYTNYLSTAPDGFSGPYKGKTAGIDSHEEDPYIRFYNAVDEELWEYAASILDSLLDNAKYADEEKQIISLMGSLYRWSGLLSTGCNVLSSVQLTIQSDDFATFSRILLESSSGDNSTAFSLVDGLLCNTNTNPGIAALALMEKGFLLKYGLDNIAGGDDIFEDFLDDYPNHPESDVVRIELGLEPVNIGGGAIDTFTIHPCKYQLFAAYPNPFNPTTTIRFGLPHACHVKLQIFDIQGRRVGATRVYPFGASSLPIIDGYRTAGYHEVTFDASNLASGLYIYRIQAADFSAVRKMVLMK